MYGRKVLQFSCHHQCVIRKLQYHRGMKLLMIKYNLALIVLFLLFSSCATVLNSPVQKVIISTDKNIKVISVDRVTVIDSSFKQINSTRAYYIPRNNEPLKVKLQIDSTPKTIFLKPVNSFAFWYNIPSTYGIGMLVDKDNMKRYSYPKRNYLKLEDTLIKRYNFAPTKKGTLNLSLSLPYITGFSIRAIDEQYNSEGIFGLEAGLDYFYLDNNHLSVNLGIATDRFGEYFGPGYIQSANVKYLSLRNNNIIGSLNFGYGINVSQLKWTQQTIGDTIKNDHLIKNTQLGPSFSAQYRLGYYFSLGVLYQPTLINANFKSSFKYEHYLSFNFSWKLPIYRPDK